MNGVIWISAKISLTFVSKDPINNITAVADNGLLDVRRQANAVLLFNDGLLHYSSRSEQRIFRVPPPWRHMWLSAWWRRIQNITSFCNLGSDAFIDVKPRIDIEFCILTSRNKVELFSYTIWSIGEPAVAESPQGMSCTELHNNAVLLFSRRCPRLTGARPPPGPTLTVKFFANFSDFQSVISIVL